MLVRSPSFEQFESYLETVLGGSAVDAANGALIREHFGLDDPNLKQRPVPCRPDDHREVRRLALGNLSFNVFVYVDFDALAELDVERRPLRGPVDLTREVTLSSWA